MREGNTTVIVQKAGSPAFSGLAQKAKAPFVLKVSAPLLFETLVPKEAAPPRRSFGRKRLRDRRLVGASSLRLDPVSAAKPILRDPTHGTNRF
jgi:hypothetical protein